MQPTASDRTDSDSVLGARFRPPPHVVSTDAVDATVLLDVERGKYYTLNEVGGRVWALLPSEPVGAIVARLQKEYDVPPAQVEADVLALVEQLRRDRLIEPVTP